MERINIKNITPKKIIKLLKSGGLVIMPTETLYGAFVDATNHSAVIKLNKYKKRPFGKPYSVAVSSLETAKKYVYINKTAEKLYKNFLPGPLTIVSKGRNKVAQGIESEDGTLGIRIPDYKLILDVCSLYKKPLTATSANASYKKRPYSVEDVLDNLSKSQTKLIDLIVDAGKLPKNDPSTVIDTTLDDVSILRQGNLKFGKNKAIISKSPEDTANFAKNLWQKYENQKGKRAIVFALKGKMGVGKTVFAKGLAKALQIGETITSPTYDLINQYFSKKENINFIHIDAWRIYEEKELQDLDFTKSITDKSVFAIEWADKVADTIRQKKEDALIVWVDIKYLKEKNKRQISWSVI